MVTGERYDACLRTGHDGHGSVRVLFDMAAAIAQVFAFDAYGQMLGIHDAIANPVNLDQAITSLLYSGEHFDADIQRQYFRARFYDPATGRFNRLDPFAGNVQEPQSLHKYLYVHGDPIQGVDATGLFTVVSMNVGMGGLASLNQMQADAYQGVLDAVEAASEGISADQHIRNVLFESGVYAALSTGLMVLAVVGLGVFSRLDGLLHGFWQTRKHVRRRLHHARRPTSALHAVKHIRAASMDNARLRSLPGPNSEASYFPGIVKAAKGHLGMFEKAAAHKALKKNQMYKHGGTIYVFHKFDVDVGYNNGQKTKWVRIEITDSPTPEMHSFPANIQQVRNYIPGAKA
jgi:RHS repeat-associated protein